ncbi:unnamed protein product [Vitrella brassicaformis CCMP3155]|uniref:IPT/TIG domain-containing protein n=2 Tax=Vitrella brassicaformis TaxID=1169539 RepID=A0A0G4GDH5_VITBC|nr:unnamed protein product [Vitrella brassicaformis CCMP3155]|eukprot:CEM27051.1 unnamed protein product [Vitrella brassicaformis CCMP3155]
MLMQSSPAGERPLRNREASTECCRAPLLKVGPLQDGEGSPKQRWGRGVEKRGSRGVGAGEGTAPIQYYSFIFAAPPEAMGAQKVEKAEIIVLASPVMGIILAVLPGLLSVCAALPRLNIDRVLSCRGPLTDCPGAFEVPAETLSTATDCSVLDDPAECDQEQEPDDADADDKLLRGLGRRRPQDDHVPSAEKFQLKHSVHPVLSAPRVAVDYDGDGAEVVILDGDQSHSHETNADGALVISRWQWSVNNTTMSDGKREIHSASLPLGRHWVRLKVHDSSRPSKQEEVGTYVDVVRPDKVPGVQVWLYSPNVADNPSIEKMLHKSPEDLAKELTPSFVGKSFTSFSIPVDQKSGNLAGSGLSKNVMANVRAKIVLDESINPDGEVTVELPGVTKAAILINGLPVKSGEAISLPTNTTADFDVRFGLSDRATDVPSVEVNRKAVEAFAADDVVADGVRVFHDETAMKPHINAITPKHAPVGETKSVTITGAGFIMPQDSKALRVVIGGRNESLIPTQVSPTRIKVDMPATHAEHTYGVSVASSRGNSNWAEFKVSAASSSMPEIKFHPPTAIRTKARPTAGAWGVDNRFYMGSMEGLIEVYDFDMDYNVKKKQTLKVIDEKYPGDTILGIRADPYSDPEKQHLYVAHSNLGAAGGNDCEVTKKHGMVFPGRISRITGPDYTRIEKVVTNLPAANKGGLGPNGIDFSLDGDLFWAQASVGNGGPPVCFLGGLQDSPLTASVNRAQFRRPDYTPDIDYVWKNTTGMIAKGLANKRAPNDQREASSYSIAPWVKGIEWYAAGFHNPFSIVWTTDGELWTTTNGLTGGNAWDTTQIPEYIKRMQEGSCAWPECQPPAKFRKSVDRVTGPLNYKDYGGYPNPARALEGDERQWYYFSAADPPNPMIYKQGFAVDSSVNGITEFRGNCFNGQLKGDLLAQQWDKKTYRLDRPKPGEKRQTTLSVLTGKLKGLTLNYGPQCAVISVDFTAFSIKVMRPDDEAAKKTDQPLVYDINRWRASPEYDQTLHIGGANFNKKGRKATKLTIGGRTCDIKTQSDGEIRCVLPSAAKGDFPRGFQAIDVSFSDGTKGHLDDAFIYLKPGMGLESNRDTKDG